MYLIHMAAYNYLLINNSTNPSVKMERDICMYMYMDILRDRGRKTEAERGGSGWVEGKLGHWFWGKYVVYSL